MNIKRTCAVVTALVTAVSATVADAATDDTEPVVTESTVGDSGPPGSDVPSPTVSEEFEAQWEDLIAAAQAEGELSVVSGPGSDQDEEFFAAFGELFDIEVSNFGGQTDEVTARVAAERDQGIYDYDIGNLGDSGTNVLLDAGYFIDITPLMIHPDIGQGDLFATGYIPWAEADRKYCAEFAIQAGGNVSVFYYNTENVTEEDIANLNSYFDLHDPRWTGRIVMGDVLEGQAGEVRNRTWAVLGEEWFDGIFANDVTVLPYGSEREYADALARGDFDIGLFPPGEASLTEAIDAGLPVARMDKIMAEGELKSPIQRVCVFDDAPHPAAAQLYLNWVFTNEGGTVFNETTGRTNRTHIRLDAPIGHIEPRVYDAMHDASVPIRDRFSDDPPPEFETAEAEVTAYLEAKYDELGIVPGS
jgi:ABC-type Fe3+ transport system substrate-binding protein